MLFRLLLQGLATNTSLSELELDISCCEVQTHTHIYTSKNYINLFLKFCVWFCVSVAEVGWSSGDSGTHLRGQGHLQSGSVWQRYRLLLYSLFHAASTLLSSLHTFLFISVRFILLLSMTNSFTTALEGLQGLSSHQVIN